MSMDNRPDNLGDNDPVEETQDYLNLLNSFDVNDWTWDNIEDIKKVAENNIFMNKKGD